MLSHQEFFKYKAFRGGYRVSPYCGTLGLYSQPTRTPDTFSPLPRSHSGIETWVHSQMLQPTVLHHMQTMRLSSVLPLQAKGTLELQCKHSNMY